MGCLFVEPVGTLRGFQQKLTLVGWAVRLESSFAKNAIPLVKMWRTIAHLNGGRRGDSRPVFLRVLTTRRRVLAIQNPSAVAHCLLSKCRVLYQIVYFAGGSFRFKNAEVDDVRCGRVAHSYCYFIVPVVKPMQLEMRSLCVDPAGLIPTRG